MFLKSSTRQIAAAILSMAAALVFSTPVKAQHPRESNTVTLSFSGGTAAEYVDALRDADPSANIVVLGSLADIPMHAVQLKSVDVLSALSVLNELPQEQGDIVAKVRVNDVRSNQDVPSVYTVTADVRRRGAMPGIHQTAIISMADLLNDRLKAEDALRSIEVALAMQETTVQTKIQFHQETGLLIARGEPEQIECIRQVINQLRERQASIDTRAQRQEIASLNVVARQEAETLQSEMTVFRTKAELLEKELDESRRVISSLSEALRKLELERGALMRELAELRDKNGGKPTM